MKATDELIKEHRAIDLMLRILHSAVDELEGGERIPSAHFDGIMAFLSVFVDRCHHAKEEEFLFPAMEAAGVQREGGPIGVMLMEHERGRKLVVELKEALADYLPEDKAAAARIRLVAYEYEALLTQHILKENSVIFPLANDILDAAKDRELVDAFEQLERERIGAGRHEEFHRLLEQLRDTYLK
jgi:hemerythrin-like domain-containing protein